MWLQYISSLLMSGNISSSHLGGQLFMFATLIIGGAQSQISGRKLFKVVLAGFCTFMYIKASVCIMWYDMLRCWNSLKEVDNMRLVLDVKNTYEYVLKKFMY